MGSLASTRILVADDDPIVQFHLQAVLTQQGVQHIMVAESGQQALALAMDTPPDVAILDIGLQDASGWDVVTRLKAHSPHTLLVMLTGSRDMADLQRATQHGVHAYCCKPLDGADLMRTLDKLLQKLPATHAG
jgi:DNA-binding NarL/FixJ family response regulator